jgi:hypothetical protein
MKVLYRESEYATQYERELEPIVKSEVDATYNYSRDEQIETLQDNIEQLQKVVTSLLVLLFKDKQLSGNDLSAILGLPTGTICRIK